MPLNLNKHKYTLVFFPYWSIFFTEFAAASFTNKTEYCDGGRSFTLKCCNRLLTLAAIELYITHFKVKLSGLPN